MENLEKYRDALDKIRSTLESERSKVEMRDTEKVLDQTTKRTHSESRAMVQMAGQHA